MFYFGIYLAAGILLFPYFQYKINPDAISYITIAQKYLHGEFSAAVNGYWGPLLSWMMVPILALGIPGHTASKITLLIVGLLTLIAAYRLCLALIDKKNVRIIVMVVLLPLVLLFSMVLITTDLLLACVLLLYFGIIFKPGYPRDKYSEALCGVTGALAYFSKGYGFVFFVVHFLIFNIFHYVVSPKDEKKKVIGKFTRGLAVFLIISGIWIALISLKYGSFMISSSARYNFAIVNPQKTGSPLGYRGLLKPPNSSAVSVWEDPTLIKVRSWSPFESSKNFVYFLKLIYRNTSEVFHIYRIFTFLTPLIILSYLVLCIKPVRELIRDTKILFPTVTLLVYSAGYIPVAVEKRYYWVMYILVVIMGGHLLEKISQLEFIDHARKKAILLIFLVVYLMAPMESFKSAINFKKEIYDISIKIKKKVPLKGRAASNRPHWDISQLLCYYLDLQYLGSLPLDADPSTIKQELNKFDVDYYFLWGKGVQAPIYLDESQEITGLNTPSLRVFLLKNNTTRDNNK